MITIRFKYLNLQDGNTILDIGCGEGRHTAGVLTRKNVFCVGSDLRIADLLKTKEKLVIHETLDNFRQSEWGLSATDITLLSFKDEVFNQVICSEVLEHIENDSAAVDELLRVLKPGGVLAVSVPRYFPEKICWMLSDEYLDEDLGHIRIYRKKELVEMIEKKGGCHFKTHHAHALHSPFWWLKCLLGCRRTDSRLINLYHKLLVWDLMKKPFLTRTMETMLNPFFGKSLVLYFVKDV